MAKTEKLTSGIHWKDEPEEHDFPAATDYLSLLFDDTDTAAIVERLRSRRGSSRLASAGAGGVRALTPKLRGLSR